jgi:hypothetical protein
LLARPAEIPDSLIQSLKAQLPPAVEQKKPAGESAS